MGPFRAVDHIIKQRVFLFVCNAGDEAEARDCYRLVCNESSTLQFLCRAPFRLIILRANEAASRHIW